jgi:hypothetical protein
LTIDVLPALKGWDSFRLAHAALRWVPGSTGVAGEYRGLTFPPQAFSVSAARPSGCLAPRSRPCRAPRRTPRTSRSGHRGASDHLRHRKRSTPGAEPPCRRSPPCGRLPAIAGSSWLLSVGTRILGPVPSAAPAEDKCDNGIEPAQPLSIPLATDIH